MKIVVSGTSSGIGQALARHLARKGHAVLGLARSAQAESFSTAVCDVADYDAVAAACAGVGEVDAIICAAGIQGEIGPATQADPRVWEHAVRVNLCGTFNVIRALHAALNPQRAKVVCFSGGGATKARPFFSAYAAAKCGVVRLVETLAEEWRGTPVDINAVAPGAINTRMTEQTRAAGELAGAESTAAAKQLAHGGQSLEKAIALVEFLISPKADGITGRLLSAQWDDWTKLTAATLAGSENFQLRRITP